MTKSTLSKFSLFSVLAIAFANVASASSSAIPDTEVRARVEKAVEGQNSFVHDLRERGILAAGSRVTGIMVVEGVRVLRQAGDREAAAAFEAQWAETYKQMLDHPELPAFAVEYGIVDLGDHAPLSRWLSKFHDRLASATKGMSRSFRIVEDINTLNFALPVIFSPHGKWRTGDAKEDRVEYRKHFIPFANIGAYWAAFYGCKVGVKAAKAPVLTVVCMPAASLVEWGMGRHVAPLMADFIYSKANRRKASLSLTQDLSEADASLWTEADLYEAVQSSIRDAQ